MFVDGSSIGVGGRSECDEAVDTEAVSSIETRGGRPGPEPEARDGTSGSGAFFRLKTFDILLLIDPKVEIQSASLDGVRWELPVSFSAWCWGGDRSTSLPLPLSLSAFFSSSSLLSRSR